MSKTSEFYAAVSKAVAVRYYQENITEAISIVEAAGIPSDFHKEIAARRDALELAYAIIALVSQVNQDTTESGAGWVDIDDNLL